MTSCKICGLGPLLTVAAYRRLARVSSDCKPVQPGGELSVCRSCGAVQKQATRTFFAEIAQIYNNYDVYCQGGGAEQITLDSRDNSLKRRSDLIAELLFNMPGMKTVGAALDFGAPRDVPRGTPVFICLSPGLAQAVAKRMNAAGLNCVI